jgi:hypothetical protein
MDDLDQTAPVRGARGRFVPGQSGNPAGKRPGTRNRATQLRERLAEDDVAVVVKALMDQVRAGDGVAVRLVSNLLFPKPRDREIDLGLPPLDAGTTLTQMLNRVLSLMAAGEITIDEASRIARLVERLAPAGAATTTTTEAADRTAASGTASRATAGAVRPAFDLQTAGSAAAAAAPDDAAAPPPRNRHDRRRAAALARVARTATPGPSRLTAAA